MITNRVWSMPSKHTFTIKPIAELLQRYIGDGTGWIDPFAGFNSPASLTRIFHCAGRFVRSCFFKKTKI